MCASWKTEQRHQSLVRFGAGNRSRNRPCCPPSTRSRWRDTCQLLRLHAVIIPRSVLIGIKKASLPKRTIDFQIRQRCQKWFTIYFLRSKASENFNDDVLIAIVLAEICPHAFTIEGFVRRLLIVAEDYYRTIPTQKFSQNRWDDYRRQEALKSNRILCYNRGYSVQEQLLWA